MTKQETITLRWTRTGWEAMFTNAPDMGEFENQWIPTGFTSEAYERMVFDNIKELNPNSVILTIPTA